MLKTGLFFFALAPLFLAAQLTPFEKSGQQESSTYADCIAFYKQLDKASENISIKTMGTSDAGYPYHLVLVSGDGKFDPRTWHAQNKVIILINNGIHPGEPDGVDASMMLLRDIATGKIKLPANVALAVIPLYNIGGALNRGPHSRVNQNGPKNYGFRGNAQNLDLNRDFTKSDTRNALSFAQMFHWIDPDVQVDTHVSDGADYQHTMTLITTQWNKLGGDLGKFVHEVFDPSLYKTMQEKGWRMCPYVNFEDGSPEQGWTEFYDPPRYSSGYAALFHTISYMPETHMLKPFKDRVWSTFALLQTMIAQASAHASAIIQKRRHDIATSQQQTAFALKWETDSTHYDTVMFKGYTADHKSSAVTGMPRLYYDHNRPFEKAVRYYDYFTGVDSVRAPQAYVIPQGWHAVTDLLAANGVQMHRLEKDSEITVEVYHLDSWNPAPQAYEKHHRNTNVKVTSSMQTLSFRKGDFYIPCNQPAKRFLMEMLEPTGDDGYFAWNFFDAILQQKEGYSDYRWEDVAAAVLQENPDLRSALEAKKKTDTAFAADASAQLEYVYHHSPYYEPAHLRYPVYRALR